MSTDHKITHTHGHKHRIPHPDAWDRDTESEPHTHEHDHTSVREAGYTGDYVVHRNHFHVEKNRPFARPYKHLKED